MPTMSLHITEEELEQRIAKAASEAAQQVMQINLTQIPLKINPGELLLVSVNFSDKAKAEQIDKIVKRTYDTFNKAGITKVAVLVNTKLAKFDLSLIKETDVNVGVGGNAAKTSYEYVDKAYL